MNNTAIKLLVGEPVTDPTELNFINRLRTDLEQRGVSAVLYANFFTNARQRRQIDLLVRTDHRTAHVEIKGLNPEYPVRGGQNGEWAQVLPDGEQRSLGKNCGRQALSGTYAINDAMRNLASGNRVPSSDDGFFRHIDSIVAIWETVPDGSDISPPNYVTVIGYSELVERLGEHGPVVPWSDDDWDEFARYQDLYQPEEVSESEQQRRDSLAMIADYRLHTKDNLAEGLSPLVDLGAVGNDGNATSADDIYRKVANGGTVAIVGHSGSGKSYLAKHLAVNHCDAGRVVIWVQASDYTKGQFKKLLAEAVGPFSAEPWRNLISACRDGGVAVTIVVDGLNECPDAERAELLRRLRAFTRQHPAGMLVTTTDTGGLNGTLRADIVNVCEPDETTRKEILELHGARYPERISSQFRTPHELSIAAECENELSANSTTTELHDAYIRRHASSETLRSGLRSLATRLHAKLCTSMPLSEGASILASGDTGFDAHQTDTVLSCPLLETDRHRVRFRHELLGQHLAAEHLVRTADSGNGLGETLGVPANKVLARPALSIESDSILVWDALQTLCEGNLISCAVSGEFGAETRQKATEAIRDVLRTGISNTESDRVGFEGTHPGTLEGIENGLGCWVIDRQWTQLEKQLLACAGTALIRGLFAEEVCELVDRTDELCLARVRILKAEGIRNPASAVVAATYGPTLGPSDQCLAATIVAKSYQNAEMMAGPRDSRVSNGLAGRLSADAGDNSWGRYYLAVLSINPADRADRTVFAPLFRRAWEAGGYHLRLEALQKAEHIALFGDAAETHRAEIIEILESLETENVFLGSSIVEALALFGQIENETDPNELREMILEVISDLDRVDSCQQAVSIISCQFEDQNIVGPYYEAVETLTPHQKARLLVMAARGSETVDSLFLDWTFGQLAAIVPAGDPDIDSAAQAVFATLFDGPPENAIAPQQAALACLHAIRGWAKLGPALPPKSNDLTATQRNWRLVASLLFRYERDDALVEVEETWQALLAEPGRTAATLAQIEDAGLLSRSDEEAQEFISRNYIGCLAADYPEHMRRLLEQSLDDFDNKSLPWHSRGRDTAKFTIRNLGIVGDETTAERLRVYTLDPETGATAVEAIRRINDRVAQ